MFENALLIILLIVVMFSVVVGAVCLGFWMGRQSINMPVSMFPDMGTTRIDPEEDPYEKAMRPEEEDRISTTDE